MSSPVIQIELPRIILVNGPPSSGKDTTYQIVNDAFNCDMTPIIHEKFSLPIKRALAQVYSVPIEVFERDKDLPVDVFLGKTSRQVQISFSEEWLKELHGLEVFGMLCATRIWNLWGLARDKNTTSGCTPVFVITDSGFEDEANALIRTMGDATDRVMLLRLHRKDHTFDGDSRNYIYSEDLDYTITERDIYADDLDELRKGVLSNVSSFILGTETSE